MKQKDFKITPDNIGSVNEHLKKQFRINRRRDAAAPIARFVSIILFLASSILLVYGIGCRIEESMADFPVIGSIWKSFCSVIPIMEMKWYFSILAMLLTLYLPAFAAAFLIRFIFFLVYHPRADLKELSGSEYDQALILVENHKTANSYTGGISWLPSFDEEIITTVFAVAGAALSAVCSLVIAGITSDNKVDAIVGGFFVFVGIGLALWLVSLPYWTWLFQFFLGHTGDKYRNKIDEFWLENDPAEAERREKAKQAAAADRSRREEEYISSMAKIYAREREENEEYLRRLHEWATNGDDPTPGSGDGI